MNNLKSRKGGASLRNLKRLLCLLLVLTMLPINAFASDIIVPGSGGTSPGSGGGGSGTKWSSPTNLGPGMLLHVQSSERTVTFDYTDPANVVLGCVGTLQNRHLGWMYTSVYGSQRRQGVAQKGTMQGIRPRRPATGLPWVLADKSSRAGNKVGPAPCNSPPLGFCIPGAGPRGNCVALMPCGA